MADGKRKNADISEDSLAAIAACVEERRKRHPEEFATGGLADASLCEEGVDVDLVLPSSFSLQRSKPPKETP